MLLQSRLLAFARIPYEAVQSRGHLNNIWGSSKILPEGSQYEFLHIGLLWKVREAWQSFFLCNTIYIRVDNRRKRSTKV